MNTIILSIGSNNFSKTNIDKAKRMLAFIFHKIQFTPSVITVPEEGAKKLFPYRNILAKASQITLTPEEVITKIKTVETAVGRKPRDKYEGKVVIDIDLIKYNDKILRPRDYMKDYIQYLLTLLSDEPEQSPTEEAANMQGANAEEDEFS